MSEDQTSEVSQISFDEVLTALQDEAHPFPAKYLYRLSDLEVKELAQLKLVWPKLTTLRRLGILEDLELLAEGNTVMHFDPVYTLGLPDEDSRVRATAIRSLRSSEETRLIPEFVRLLLHDEAMEVRAQAAAALGRFVYLGEVGKVPPGTLKEVEANLFDALNSDDDPLIQRRALESLGYSSRPEVAEYIEKAFAGGEEEWVTSALFAMGRSADDRWGPLVIETLQDRHSDLRKEAARAAGELELSEAGPGLFDLLQDEDSEVRLAAAYALSQIGGNGVAEALEAMLERSEDEDETDLIENALENLAFTEEMGDLNLLDFSPEDLEEFANPDRGDEDEVDSESE